MRRKSGWRGAITPGDVAWNGGKKVDVADGGWEPLAPSAEAFAMIIPTRENDAV